MLFWLGENATQQNFIDARNFAESIGVNDGKIIFFLPPNKGKIFEPYLLRNSTHFITTREMINIECLDWLYDTDVKIISALDDNIFDGEPAVNWKEIYS